MFRPPLSRKFEQEQQQPQDDKLAQIHSAILAIDRRWRTRPVKRELACPCKIYETPRHICRPEK
jgi:hypothetical protein